MDSRSPESLAKLGDLTPALKPPSFSPTRTPREKARKPAMTAGRTPRPLEGRFDLEAFEPRLMLAANPIAMVDPSGVLTLNATTGADSFLIEHVSGTAGH